MDDGVLRFSQMPEESGLKRSAIYDRLNPKSPRYDPEFPKPFKLGQSGHAVGFSKAEVRAWVRAQMAARAVPTRYTEPEQPAKRLSA